MEVNMQRFLLLVCLTLLSWVPERAKANVKLLAMQGFDCPPVSGCYQSSKIKGTVLVKNIGPAKSVDIVYYDFYRKSWDFVPAQFLSSLPDQRELWSFLVPASVQEFAIAYHVNGTVYWDNNQGQNYKGAHYGFNAWLGENAVFFGPELQWTYVSVGTETFTSGYDPEAAYFTGGIWIKNQGDAQALTVVYTDDQWQTTHTVAAQPLPGHAYASGVELWTFQAPVAAGTPAAHIEFAVALQTGKETVWDNNFGRNFRINSELTFTR